MVVEVLHWQVWVGRVFCFCFGFVFYLLKAKTDYTGHLRKSPWLLYMEDQVSFNSSDNVVLPRS